MDEPSKTLHIQHHTEYPGEQLKILSRLCPRKRRGKEGWHDVIRGLESRGYALEYAAKIKQNTLRTTVLTDNGHPYF
jgi:hypothetical protein